MVGPGGRWRAALALTALAGAAVVVPMASPAGAVVVTCDGLQQAFNDSVDGSVITLAEGSDCTGNWTMKEFVSVTFEGGGSGATLRGIGGETTTRILRANNVKSSVIRNLTFVGGNESGYGGAIKVQRDAAATIDNVTFIGNTAGSGGGALAIRPDPGAGTNTVRNSRFLELPSANENPSVPNFAPRGGGLYIESDGPVVVTGNLFDGNVAGYTGGGLHIQAEGDSSVVLENNVFRDNAVERNECVGESPGGGGLSILGQVLLNGEVEPGGDGRPEILQRGNLFVGNRVDVDDCGGEGSGIYEGTLYGGGEYIINADVVSVDDEFVDNAVVNADGELAGDAEGGGISMLGFAPVPFTFDAHNLVLAANEAIGEGEGGGAYFGSATAIDVTLVNATIVNNAATDEGGGLSGSDADALVLRNSIVHGNTSADPGAEVEIADFESMTINYSDVCNLEALTPESGNNICADPKLVDPANGDVHQTDASPTLDAASNALVPAELTKDYEGQARISDAKGDGPTPAVVDMGADEMQAPVKEQPPAVEGDNQTAPGAIGEDDGYCLSAKDGGVFTFGGCQFFGAAGGREGRMRLLATDITAPQSLVKLNAPVVGIAMQPSDTGYWQVGEDGGVFSFGTAGFHGSMATTPLTRPIIGIASSPSGNGYWLVASDGGVFGFGDAPFLGSMGGTPLAAPIVGIAATPSGKGYWLVASDGGVFSFGDARFFGSAAGMKLNAPIVGMGSRPGGLGYWLAASDGGVFTFGDAPFLGSRVGLPLNGPVIGIKSAASGNGYWLIAGDGGVFSFGSAPFLGSMGDRRLNQPVIDMTG